MTRAEIRRFLNRLVGCGFWDGYFKFLPTRNFPKLTDSLRSEGYVK